jgi:hypothetical protein
MSKKVRLGNLGGIDLDQILAWRRIPTHNNGQWLKSKDCNLKLYIPGSTIVVIQKSTPGEPINESKGINLHDELVLEKEDFNKLVQCLDKEFSFDIPEDSNLVIPEDSNLMEQAYK